MRATFLWFQKPERRRRLVLPNLTKPKKPDLMMYVQVNIFSVDGILLLFERTCSGVLTLSSSSSFSLSSLTLISSFLLSPDSLTASLMVAFCFHLTFGELMSDKTSLLLLDFRTFRSGFPPTVLLLL